MNYKDICNTCKKQKYNCTKCKYRVENKNKCSIMGNLEMYTPDMYNNYKEFKKELIKAKLKRL